jgi:hypothetical protein
MPDAAHPGGRGMATLTLTPHQATLTLAPTQATLIAGAPQATLIAGAASGDTYRWRHTRVADTA